VVSIGNLAAGGRGKTPLAAFLARSLAEGGERPAILSRGYARTCPDIGVTVVSDGTRLGADLGRAGDEPLMLARALPGVVVVVCPDRYLAGRLAELHLAATVHVLDDGFQHFGLARDVDLLLIDPADVEHPATLPGGRLREPLDAARDADALLVTDATQDQARVLADRLGVAEAFAVVRDVEPAVEETIGGPRPLAPGGRVLIVSGIARPERFQSESAEAGFDVAGALSFPDHYPYRAADVARIATRAGAVGAGVVLTTEKDLVRLLPHRPWPFRLAVRPMSVRVQPEAAFAAWLLAKLWPEAGAPGRGPREGEA
jgi:tetraacyldisaccharide 4'-kinase